MPSTRVPVSDWMYPVVIVDCFHGNDVLGDQYIFDRPSTGHNKETN